MLLMIDNYDSFTYNLVQYFGELGEDVRVFRNNKITIDEIELLQPSRIVISPGPCTPMEAGVSVETIRHFGGRLPLLGVCLGHQSLAVAFGGEVVRAERLMHGKTSKIQHDGKTIFHQLPDPFDATRYHSLIVKRETLPPALRSLPKRPRGKSWDCAIGRWASKGCSFIRNRSSPWRGRTSSVISLNYSRPAWSPIHDQRRDCHTCRPRLPHRTSKPKR